MGRHQAPARHRRKSAGGEPRQPAADALPAAAPPQPQQPQAGWQPPQPPQPPQQPAAADQPEVRKASWWLLLETGAVAVVITIVGILVLGAGVVVDGLEVIVGAGLLLAPLLVRHVVLRVHRRWTALLVAYVAFLVVAFSALVAGDLVVLHTVAGFGSSALGVLAAGAGFVLASRVFAPKQQAQTQAQQPQTQAQPAQPPAAPTPPPPAAPAPVFHPAPDESDTDTLPQVIPHNDEREDDSLAG